jgi:periplasmic protein
LIKFLKKYKFLEIENIMRKVTFVIFTLIPSIVYADLPLSLEDILTDKGKLKLEASVSYINGESNHSELSSPIYIQTGTANFIAVPTEVRERNQNSDMVVGTLGLRYGLTGNTDIYGSGSYLWREDRQFDGESRKTRDDSLSDISLGISHTFLKDEKNPALIGFIEGTVYEKSHGKVSSGKSWLIGATTYKSIDPIVLSLTAAYRFNGSKTLLDGVKYREGNYWFINPSVAFAANDRISLIGGIQWLSKQPDQFDGKKESIRTSSTYAHLGTGIGFTKATSMNISARFGISGQSSSELKLGVQHTF